MKVLVIGSGIAGLSAAIHAAENNCRVKLVSPYVSERSQSVMAAGGINAALDTLGENDSTEIHIEDTLKGGLWLEDEKPVRELCQAAPDIVRWLDSIGVVFSRSERGEIAQRAFGGQSKRRTAYAGASTGKQIVTALTQKCREYEISGSIDRCTGLSFHSLLIEDGRCYGGVFTDDITGEVTAFETDAVIMATGGMNKLFGKTTGSELCDGYAAGRLLAQGVVLRNLEFIQYHPTTIETANKRMLISEAVRGEGGRLYYEEDGRRIYFMEDMYGENGNLMPRDVVSRCIWNCPSQVYLDITFLGKKLIHERLEEVEELCSKYLDLDISKESIPVAPSVHFFMGGIRVDDEHRTNIDRLYAAGECASKYHGANRLGGNSLLAAVYSGKVAAEACARRIADEGEGFKIITDFSEYMDSVKRNLEAMSEAGEEGGSVSGIQMRSRLAQIMNRDLGIVRDAQGLNRGLDEIDQCLVEAENPKFDSNMSLYDNYKTGHMLLVARAILMNALKREESRGAHFRSDHPETKEGFRRCTLTRLQGDKIVVGFEESADIADAENDIRGKNIGEKNLTENDITGMDTAGKDGEHR